MLQSVSLHEEFNVDSSRLRHDALVGHGGVSYNAHTRLGRIVEENLAGHMQWRRRAAHH